LLNDRKTQAKKGNLPTPLADITSSSLNRSGISHAKVPSLTAQAKPTNSKVTKLVSGNQDLENKTPCTNYTPTGTKRSIDHVGTKTTGIKNKPRVDKCNIEPKLSPLFQTTPSPLSNQITNFGYINSRSQSNCTNPTESQLQNLHSNLQRTTIGNVKKYIPGLNLLNKFTSTLTPHKPSPSPKVGIKRKNEESHIVGNSNNNKRNAANIIAGKPSHRSHPQTSLIHPNIPQSGKSTPTANAFHRTTITDPLETRLFNVTPPTLKNQFYFSPNELLRSQSSSTKPNQSHFQNEHSHFHHFNSDVIKSVLAQTLRNKFQSTIPTHTHSAFSQKFGTIHTTVQYKDAANINVNMKSSHHSPTINIPSLQQKSVRVPLPVHLNDPQPSQVNGNHLVSAQTPTSLEEAHQSSTTRKSIETDAEYFHTMSDRVPRGNTYHVRVNANYGFDSEIDNSDQNMEDSSSDDDIDITDEIYGQGRFIFTIYIFITYVVI